MAELIPTYELSSSEGRAAVEKVINRLRLDPRDLALARGDRAKQTTVVQSILADVAARGDDALIEIARKFDDPEFTQSMLTVDPTEMAEAAKRIPPSLHDALRRSIDQVREYQTLILPPQPPRLRRAGVELGMRFTPLDSAGLYFPGGKAAYPSSLIMLGVPAQVAGVKRIVVCSPASKYGQSDVVLAACHELGIVEFYRAGGAAAIAALAFGTKSIPAVDKIVGPGNSYVQLAKRLLAGAVGLDGYLGPSEIVILADESGDPRFIAADLLAQAEHDPGSCFLLTNSAKVAAAVRSEIEAQLKCLKRQQPILAALKDESAIIVGASLDQLIELANRLAVEHVNLQTKDDVATLSKLAHAGAVFLGPHSPVAAGDYVAGPSHCLPTNTTARFSSGISVYEFLKRTSIVRYDIDGIRADAPSIIELANAEHLDAHANSVSVRTAQ